MVGIKCKLKSAGHRWDSCAREQQCARQAGVVLTHDADAVQLVGVWCMRDQCTIEYGLSDVCIGGEALGAQDALT